MESKEKRINITLPNGKDSNVMLFGHTSIELQDLTKGVFVTDNIASFKDYESGDDTIFFLTPTKIESFTNTKLLQLKYDSLPEAVCNLKLHSAIILMASSLNKTLDLTGFLVLLKSLKNYATAETLKIIDSLNDLKIKKIVQIQHKTDNRGNFAIGVTADSGKQDYKFPETISFNLPLLQGNNYTARFDFDLMFSWKMEEQSASLEFKLVNLEFTSQTEQSIYAAIEAELQDSGTVYRGSFKIEKQLDDFKYKTSNFNF